MQYTDLLQRLFPLALFWQTQCNIGKKEDKLEFFMRQNYIAAVHASRAGLSDLVGPSTIAYFDLTLAFETVPFVHTLFFLHCKYFHYHKYNFSLYVNFQCNYICIKLVRACWENWQWMSPSGTQIVAMCPTSSVSTRIFFHYYNSFNRSKPCHLTVGIHIYMTNVTIKCYLKYF